jgi:hypothetical protein
VIQRNAGFGARRGAARSTSTPWVRPTTWETHSRPVSASEVRHPGSPRARRGNPARAGGAQLMSRTSAPSHRRALVPHDHAQSRSFLHDVPLSCCLARRGRPVRGPRGLVAVGRPAPVPRRAAGTRGAARGPRSPLRGLDRAGPRLHRKGRAVAARTRQTTPAFRSGRRRQSSTCCRCHTVPHGWVY